MLRSTSTRSRCASCPDQLAGLADDLGFLPLALSQAAAYLFDVGLDCVTYRHRLADRSRTLIDVLPDGEAGQAAAALHHFQHLAGTTRHHLGPDHPDTLAARHIVAYWRGKAGDAIGAAAAFEQLLPDRERVLGPDHPDTLATRKALTSSREEGKRRSVAQSTDP
ncbi:tetratricopeptide repeat protein [Streptomyces sp. NPDC002088]|uniref:tetratricopeptide repeat protein n=1 Tax=Streptomyces sp. NPDC002088 TaxID=3154665 RepID=UPI003324709D